MEYKSFTLSDLPPSERPRERMARLGVESLSEQELLAVLLGRGTSGESVMVTAQGLIARFHGLQGLADTTLEELCKVKGIKLAKAAQIKAALEISQRLACNSGGDNKRDPIKGPEDVVSFVKHDLVGRKKEHFMVVYLDTRNRPMNRAPVSIGTLNSSLVHPREAFKDVIAAGAANVIFVHNHPSGDPQPSDDDIEITRKLVEAGKLLRIEVLDHIIVTDHDYLSMKAKKLL